MQVGLGLRFEHLDDVVERVEAGTLPDDVSFFEISPENFMRRGGPVPAALARIAEARPVFAHGLTLSLGGPAPEAAFWSELEALFARVPPRFYGDHLSFGAAAPDVHLQELLPLPSSRDATRHATRRAREAKARVEAPFTLENPSFYGTWGPGELDDRAQLVEVLEGADVRWLLDVNNLVVNAKNGVGSLGPAPARTGEEIVERVQAWLEGTPLGRVAYLHVAGHEWWADDERFVDTHGADVGRETLALLPWVLARTGPVPILVERDHHVPPFDVLVEEARRVRRAAEGA